MDKFIGKSLTFWGLVIAAASSLLPVFGPMVGMTITATDVAEIGKEGEAFINSIGTAFGLGMALVGRIRAKAPLSFRK